MTQPQPVRPYDLNADQLERLAKALTALDKVSRETGVDLTGPSGSGGISIGDVDLRLRSEGQGANRRYHLDIGQY